MFSNANIKIFRMYSIPIYITSIILLALVFIVGIESRGSLRWIEIFGFRIQFSEILKPFLAISLASFVSDKRVFDFKASAKKAFNSPNALVTTSGMLI